MSANRGPFEPCLAPRSGSVARAPHGIARVLASQAAHASDFARLGVNDIDEEARINAKHEQFIDSAKRFVAACADLGATWEESEPLIDNASARARIALSFSERQELFERWHEASTAEEQAA